MDQRCANNIYAKVHSNSHRFLTLLAFHTGTDWHGIQGATSLLEARQVRNVKLRTWHLRMRLCKKQPFETAAYTEMMPCFPQRVRSAREVWMLQSVCVLQSNYVAIGQVGETRWCKRHASLHSVKIDLKRSCTWAACAWHKWMTWCKRRFWQIISPLGYSEHSFPWLYLHSVFPFSAF